MPNKLLQVVRYCLVSLASKYAHLSDIYALWWHYALIYKQAPGWNSIMSLCKGRKKILYPLANRWHKLGCTLLPSPSSINQAFLLVVIELPSKLGFSEVFFVLQRFPPCEKTTILGGGTARITHEYCTTFWAFLPHPYVQVCPTINVKNLVAWFSDAIFLFFPKVASRWRKQALENKLKVVNAVLFIDWTSTELLLFWWKCWKASSQLILINLLHWKWLTLIKKYNSTVARDTRL